MVVDKFNFIVFEKNSYIYNQIRNAIIKYAVCNNVETDIYRFSEDEQLNQLADFSKNTHIAFLNADYGEISLKAGKYIFNEDEDVLIVFYGKNNADLKPFFCARPIEYIDFDGCSLFVENIVGKLHRLLCEKKNVFTWTSKNLRIFIPENRIIYMQSYKGYVDVVTISGNRYHIPGKLDSVQEKLQNSSFLRIHKSTVINIRYLRSIDRSNKCCVMSNNDIVYISKAYYKSANEFLET